jgi:hypothetical protein
MLETGSLERRDAHLDLPPVTPPTEEAYIGRPLSLAPSWYRFMHTRLTSSALALTTTAVIIGGYSPSLEAIDLQVDERTHWSVTDSIDPPSHPSHSVSAPN